MNPWLLFLSYSIANSVSLNTGPLQEFKWKPGSVAWGLESLSCTEYRTNEMWNQTQDAHLICCKAVTLPLAQHNTSRSETPLQYLAAPFKSLMYVLHDFTFSL